MTKRSHIHRPCQQSAIEAAKERAKRDRFQLEKPNLSDLVASGDNTDPMPHGEFWDICRTMEKLKSLRVASGLSLADITKQTGIDRSALSRLENGIAVNPTIKTLYRFASALGNQIVASLVDKNNVPTD